MKIELGLPVKDVYITQPFGVNWLDFYTKLGMKGHNGIDFKAKRGCVVNAAHGGTVVFSGEDGGGGISVEIITYPKGEGYKTIYYHLKETAVFSGQKIKEGIVIGYADNTGIYTTGDHLHFGLKLAFDGITLDSDNGYHGAVDPSPYFKAGKHWDKSNAYHRYGRNGNWLAEFKMRFKNPWLHRQLNKTGSINKIYDNEFINALVYGGWDFDSVINPAMYEVWGWVKKDEYLRGRRPFK